MQIIIREAQAEDYLSIGYLIKDELGYKDLNFEKLFERLQIMKSSDKHLTIVAVRFLLWVFIINGFYKTVFFFASQAVVEAVYQ
jgi:predicted N-acetyltransferase YhbS